MEFTQIPAICKGCALSLARHLKLKKKQKVLRKNENAVVGRINLYTVIRTRMLSGEGNNQLCTSGYSYRHKNTQLWALKKRLY